MNGKCVLMVGKNTNSGARDGAARSSASNFASEN